MSAHPIATSAVILVASSLLLSPYILVAGIAVVLVTGTKVLPGFMRPALPGPVSEVRVADLLPTFAFQPTSEGMNCLTNLLVLKTCMTIIQLLQAPKPNWFIHCRVCLLLQALHQVDLLQGQTRSALDQLAAAVRPAPALKDGRK